MHIDHVVLAARGRDEAEEALTAVGLGVARERIVDGFGLSNLVVPLGESMLEITYPNGEEVDPALPPFADRHRAALEAHSEPLVPVAWLVRYDQEAELRRRAESNALPVAEIPALGPGHPAYLLASSGANVDRPWLPSLICWQAPPEEWPATLSAPHTRKPTGIIGVDIAGPLAEIESWCGGLPEGARVVLGRQGPRRVYVGFVEGPRATLGLEPS